MLINIDSIYTIAHEMKQLEVEGDRRSESIGGEGLNGAERRRAGEQPARMACSTSLCLLASVASPAYFSSSSRFLSVGHASSVPSMFRYALVCW
jgi:hypothetical protein